jgi:hypothetical protein
MRYVAMGIWRKIAENFGKRELSSGLFSFLWESPLPNSVFPKLFLIFQEINIATYIIGKQGPWDSC